MANNQNIENIREALDLDEPPATWNEMRRIRFCRIVKQASSYFEQDLNKVNAHGWCYFDWLVENCKAEDEFAFNAWICKTKSPHFPQKQKRLIESLYIIYLNSK